MLLAHHHASLLGTGLLITLTLVLAVALAALYTQSTADEGKA